MTQYEVRGSANILLPLAPRPDSARDVDWECTGHLVKMGLLLCEVVKRVKVHLFASADGRCEL